jgi:hypothetical protein
MTNLLITSNGKKNRTYRTKNPSRQSLQMEGMVKFLSLMTLLPDKIHQNIHRIEWNIYKIIRLNQISGR